MGNFMSTLYRLVTCMKYSDTESEQQQFILPKPTMCLADEIRQQVCLRRRVVCEQIVEAIEQQLKSAITLNGRVVITEAMKPYPPLWSERVTFAYLLTKETKALLEAEGWKVTSIMISLFCVEEISLEYKLL